MRQVKLLALMTAMSFLLCSCSGGKTDKEQVQEIQNEYSDMESMTITANVTADYGDRVYVFKLRYTGNDKDGQLEVIEPESIAGLTAVLSSESSSLCYDGAQLALGQLTPDGVSPMECIPMMMGLWANGYAGNIVSEKLSDKDTLAVTFTADENTYLVTWFEKDTYLPVKAEILYDDSMVICCQFENVIT